MICKIKYPVDNLLVALFTIVHYYPKLYFFILSFALLAKNSRISKKVNHFLSAIFHHNQRALSTISSKYISTNCFISQQLTIVQYNNLPLIIQLFSITNKPQNVLITIKNTLMQAFTIKVMRNTNTLLLLL